MRSVKSLIAAGAASLVTSAAFAADMAIAPPPPMYAPPPVVEDFGGWYLRGDIGFSNQRVNRLKNVLDANATSSVQNLTCNTAGRFGLGAGVGGARVSISNFTDQGIVTPLVPGPALASLAFGDNVAKWNFAWALHAGVAYKVTPNFTVELAYRYLDMGNGLTGDLHAFDGTNSVNNPMTFKHITSHDLKLGVRWDLTSPHVYAPPLVTKG